MHIIRNGSYYYASNSQAVPCCEVTMDKLLLSEILHPKCNLMTYSKQQSPHSQYLVLSMHVREFDVLTKRHADIANCKLYVTDIIATVTLIKWSILKS